MTFLLLRRGLIRSYLPDRLLSFLLLLYTLRVAYWMMGFAGWYDVRDWHTTFMFYFPFNHWLAVGPIIYLYFLSASNQSFRFERKYFLHFIPALLYVLRWVYIIIIDLVVNHVATGEPLPDFYGTRGNLRTNGLGLLDNYWVYLETVSVLIYIIITLRLFYKYREYINNHFSDTEDIDMRWLRNFLIVNLIGTLIWTGFNLANLFLDQPLSYIEDWYSFLFLGIILYYLGIAGYQSGGHSRIVNELHFDPNEQVDVSPATNEGDDQMQELYQRSEVVMKEEEAFLNPALSLSSLAGMLKCNAGFLSRTINSMAGKNFNQYVNGYRIDYFKEKVKDPELKHLSLLAIAEDSGFNSKATFNRAFKKTEGISPSAYLKSIQNT